MPNIFFVVANYVLPRWSNSHSKFREPVVYGQKAIQQHLNQAWNTFFKIAQGKAHKATSEEWEPKLDRLLDISFWRCPIFCSDQHATCTDVCNDQAHCLSSCALKYRLLKKELLLVKA